MKVRYAVQCGSDTSLTARNFACRKGVNKGPSRFIVPASETLIFGSEAAAEAFIDNDDNYRHRDRSVNARVVPVLVK